MFDKTILSPSGEKTVRPIFVENPLHDFAAIAALNIAQKILAGNFQAGYQTPAKAYGADLVLEIEAVARQDAN